MATRLPHGQEFCRPLADPLPHLCRPLPTFAVPFRSLASPLPLLGHSYWILASISAPFSHTFPSFLHHFFQICFRIVPACIFLRFWHPWNLRIIVFHKEKQGFCNSTISSTNRFRDPFWRYLASLFNHFHFIYRYSFCIRFCIDSSIPFWRTLASISAPFQLPFRFRSVSFSSMDRH